MAETLDRTLATVRAAIEAARSESKDEAEQLDRQGYLLTYPRLMQLRVEAMEQIIDMIDQTPAHRILDAQGQTGNLAEDYRKALIEHLGTLAGHARTKWFTK